MRKLLLLSALLTLGGCLSIVNNNGQPPQETNTGVGVVRQLHSSATPMQVVMLPNGQYAALLSPQITPTAIPTMPLNVEGNILLSPASVAYEEHIQETPISRTRGIATDCLPCDCVPCEQPSPVISEPTPTPTPTVAMPITKPCTSLNIKQLAAILNRNDFGGQYIFCQSLSDTLMIDVAFNSQNGLVLALLNSGKKKESTILARRNIPILTINNRIIQDEYNGKTNAIAEWLRCQLDNNASVVSAE